MRQALASDSVDVLLVSPELMNVFASILKRIRRPDGTEVRNPEEWALNTDPLVLQLWTHARDSLPAPTADFGTEHTGET